MSGWQWACVVTGACLIASGALGFLAQMLQTRDLWRRK